MSDMESLGGVQAQQSEQSILASCHAAMAKLQYKAPDWYAHYEDAQPDSAEKDVLLELLRTAPDDFSRGLLYGTLIMQMAIREITQREVG